MAKSTISYFNALDPSNADKWEMFNLWMDTGYYASRPPGEVHGPFIAETECLVLEHSYPGQRLV